MIAYLEDIKLTSREIDGLRNSVISQDRENDKGRQGKKFTEELTFTGRAFELIKKELIDPLDGNARTLKFELYDDCCSDSKGGAYLLFEGVIKGDSVDWCYGDCSCTATASKDDEKIDCFESTLIHDNHKGFRQQEHPRIAYCLEMRPGVLHLVILLVGFAVMVIMYTLLPIVAIIGTIIRLVCKIPGVKCRDSLKNGLTKDYLRFISLLTENLIGCGRKHPSPLIRDYIQNVCEKCGITSFKSSIYNDKTSDYFNTVYYFPQIDKGTRKESLKFDEDNAPVLTGTGLLDQLKPVHNAQYLFENDELLFERKDHFKQIFGQWLSYADLEKAGLINEKLCFKWSGDEKPAYARFEYAKDAIDTVGSEASFIYNDIVEWNSPYSAAQRGEKRVQLEFAPARFRNDNIDNDILTKVDWLPFGFGATIRKYDNALITNNGTCFAPKLLIWDGVSRKDSFVKKFNGTYNYPFFFNEDNNVKGTVQASNKPNCGLYPRFHEIDNPRTTNKRGWDWSFSFNYTCEHLKTFNINKSILLPDGLADAEIDSIKINPNQRLIEVNGTV